MATKVCQDLKVGPYYTGFTAPQFNQDGSPYVAPVVDPAILEDGAVITGESTSEEIPVIVDEPVVTEEVTVAVDEPVAVEETLVVEEAV
jgi:hypothetical protein